MKKQRKPATRATAKEIRRIAHHFKLFVWVVSTIQIRTNTTTNPTKARVGY
jgi:hypothetical protein